MTAIAATKTDLIESRIDRTAMHELAMRDEGTAPAFQSMRDILEFAKVMAVSGIAVREHLRNNPGACAAICLQASRWAMDPFMVGNKSYSVNNQLAYESQLITAVINTRAPIKGRLKTRYTGNGPERRCVAYATFKGEDELTEVESPAIKDINPKNSPLWKTDPDQQLAYYTKRLWARRECPEILLGVYDREEIEAGVPAGPEHARDVTPIPPRPTREVPVEPEASPAEIEAATAGGAAMDAEFAGAVGERAPEPEPAKPPAAPNWDQFLSANRIAIKRAVDLAALGLVDQAIREHKPALPALVAKSLAGAISARRKELDMTAMSGGD